MNHLQVYPPLSRNRKYFSHLSAGGRRRRTGHADCAGMKISDPLASGAIFRVRDRSLFKSPVPKFYNMSSVGA
eukprot:1013179-Amorphochlora_amoeboformis.AAC.1